MADATLLNLVLYLPLIGIALITAVSGRQEELVRRVSLAVMLVQFVLAAYLYLRFDATTRWPPLARRVAMLPPMRPRP